MKKIIFSLLCAACVFGCCKESNYLGEWVEPIPGMDGFQGVLLEKDGKASSVNMQTLVYETWALRGDSLVLTGKSAGNGQTIEFAENFTLEKSDGEWVLRAADGSVTYRRRK